MPNKKVAEKSEVTKPVPSPKPAKTAPAEKSAGLTVKVYDLKGKESGTIALPKEIFGQKPNQNLLAQALRVFASNVIPQSSNTKTRGEVRGGGIKPWKQKGTGRARAGSRRSPLWVGGGTTFGPRTKNVQLDMPQKMKHKALIYALSSKAQSGQIKVIANIETIDPKTKPVASLIKAIGSKRKNLLIVSEKNQNLKLATRNIVDLLVETPNNLNAYQVLKINELLISKESIAKFK